MPEQYPLSIAPLRNVAALTTLCDRLINRPLNLDRMGVFYGPSGDGKTTATRYARNKFDALLVACKSYWTKKTLFQEISAECGLKTTGAVHEMARQIAIHMATENRILIVDEADFLVQKNMVEVLRDIHEDSQQPVIMVGEEALPQKLQKWERIHGRVVAPVATESAELDDVFTLAAIYAPELEIDRAFAKRLLEASGYSIRRICNNLADATEIAAGHGVARMDLELWGDRAFITGDAPIPRGGPAARAGRATA